MSFRTYISVVSYSYEIASFWISYLPDNCYSRQFVFLFFMQVWVRFWWNDIGVNTTLWWTSGYHNWIAELSSISGYILGSSIHRQPLIWNRVSSNRDFQCSLSWATLSTFSRGSQDVPRPVWRCKSSIWSLVCHGVSSQWEVHRRPS